MNKKVLITGGTGFIGQNIVNQLIEKGYEVHSLVYPPFVFLFRYYIMHFSFCHYTESIKY